MKPTPAQVTAAAVDVIRPEYVTVWLRCRNRMLDDRTPADLIDAGEGQRVLDLLNTLASGNLA